MAYTTDIERLNYYEGEYLGALDFAAEQEYHREMRRRHNVGQHTWGIVSGLDLAQVPNGLTTAGVAQVDVYVQPGMAVDAFGREIILLSAVQLTQDLFAAFYDQNANAPVTMYIWIAYDQQLAQLSGDACTRQNTSNPYNNRVRESSRLLVTSTSPPNPPINDPLAIDGRVTPSGSSPAPGDIVLPADNSVSYQEFARDDTTTHWYIPLGRVSWHPHLQVFVQTDLAVAAAGRQYCGAVAAMIEAPNVKLVIQDRMTPSPLPPGYPGVAVEVQGELTVDRLLTALDDVVLYEHHRLIFGDPNGGDGDTPLWIRRYTNSPGADLHINIGDAADSTKRLTVGYGKVDAQPQIVFDVRADGNVDIPSGSQTIGAGLTIDQLDANDGKIKPGLTFGNGSGEGIASKRTATGNRFGLDFYTLFTPRLSIRQDGRVGIGTQTPALGLQLDVNGDFGHDDGPVQLHLFGSRIGDWGDGTLFLRSGGGIVAFDGNDRVGIGTTAPSRNLHVEATEIHSGGSGAGFSFGNRGTPGFVEIPANGERWVWYSAASSARLWSGSDKLVVTPAGNVGIGTQTPAKKLAVDGSVIVTGNLGTNGLDADALNIFGGGIFANHVFSAGAKAFIIDHPLDAKGKYLVHSALEGPECAVFYRGEARLAKGRATITLPNYFEALTLKENRSVLLTPKFKPGASVATLAASEITNGKFTVHSAGRGNTAQEFFWEVKAIRSDVAPLIVELPKATDTGKASTSAPNRSGTVKTKI
jgi:hypothetical protein